MLERFRRHWPEYFMEGALLALFLLTACTFAILLEHPSSPIPRRIEDPFVRRALMGIAMGCTAIGLIHSPWGKQSGAHMNPAVTLAFLWLGKIDARDACCYALAQLAGGVAGIAAATAAAGALVGHPSVRYVTTQPGACGPAVAFIAEALISFGMMLTVLAISSSKHLARYTGCFAALLVALYISFEARLSGMSMNPARSFGPAIVGNVWSSLWVYFTAPPLGMLVAAQLYLLLRGGRTAPCAKLHHENDKRCIFRCGYAARDPVPAETKSITTRLST